MNLYQQPGSSNLLNVRSGRGILIYSDGKGYESDVGGVVFLSSVMSIGFKSPEQAPHHVKIVNS